MSLAPVGTTSMALAIPTPVEAGQMLVILHDGALAAAQLNDPSAVKSAVKAAALRLLQRHSAKIREGVTPRRCRNGAARSSRW